MTDPAPLPASAETGYGPILKRLGFDQGQIVQEFGWDDDVDEDLRVAVEDLVQSPIEDEDWTGGAEVVLLWWREEDGDLIDALVDLVGVLEDGGFVVLLSPRPGSPGALEPSDVDEAAATAGLHSSGLLAAGDLWRATRLVSPRGEHRR